MTEIPWEDRAPTPGAPRLASAAAALTGSGTGVSRHDQLQPLVVAEDDKWRAKARTRWLTRGASMGLVNNIIQSGKALW